MPVGKTSKAQVAKIRQQVFERDDHRCIVSGSNWGLAVPCAGDLTIQHAVTRGMGGSALYDGADFLRAMCSIHNGLDTSSADFRAECLRKGWSVPRWLADTQGIKNIPVWYADGWFLLQDGLKISITETEAIDAGERHGVEVG